MNLGVLLAIIGLIVFFLGHFFIGIALMIIGVIWMIAPSASVYPRRRYWW